MTLVEGEHPTLDAIKAEATRLHVDLDAWEDDERIDLHWIERKRGSNPGDGAKIMALLCRYADQTHRFIILQIGEERLGAYYAAFGFEDYDDDLPDQFPDWEGDVMIRYPP